MHFTNEPPPPGAKIVNQQQAIPYDEAAAQRNRQQEQEVLEQQQQSEQQQFEQQQSQANQQAGSPQEAPQVQSEGSDSDNVVEGVIADPYVRNRELLRKRYERRNREDEEIVTPLPRRNRMPERMR
jgi:hypothetical protein